MKKRRLQIPIQSDRHDVTQFSVSNILIIASDAMYGRHGKIVDKTPNTPGDADLFVCLSQPRQDWTGQERFAQNCGLVAMGIGGGASSSAGALGATEPTRAGFFFGGGGGGFFFPTRPDRDGEAAPAWAP